jgi:hypothetical protein
MANGLAQDAIGTARKDGKRYTRGFSATAYATRVAAGVDLAPEMGNGKRLVLRALASHAAAGIVAGQDYASLSSDLRNGDGTVTVVGSDDVPMVAPVELFTATLS